MNDSRRTRLRLLLFAVCALTDFAAFVVVFTVTRTLAQADAGPAYLGTIGAGYSLCAGMGSIFGGWMSHRFDGRAVFVGGAALLAASVACCGLCEAGDARFVAGYALLGIALGCLYPPLMGWLNQGEDAHANRHGVSRTLVLFCIAWNAGMMCGQLTAGELYALNPAIAYFAAFAIATVNLVVAVVAAGSVRPRGEAWHGLPPLDEKTLSRAMAFKRLSWLANLGGMAGGSLVIHLLPDLMVSIGVSPARHGLLLAGWRAVIIATYLSMHCFTFWHYRLWTAIGSQLLGAGGLAIIACANSAGMLSIGLALLGQLVGYNYFAGLFYSTAGSKHERRSLAAGIHEATLAGGMALGSLVGGQLAAHVGRGTPYLLAAAFMLALMLAQYAAWSRSRRGEPG